MRGALAGAAAPLIVDLGGGDVFVAKKFLHFTDINAGIEQERGAGGAERMRIVNAVEHFPALRIAAADHRTRQCLEISHEQPVHRKFLHVCVGQTLGAGMSARPEESPRRDSRLVKVFSQGFRGYEVQANGPVFPALLLQTEGRILAVIVEAGDGQLTTSGNARARV